MCTNQTTCVLALVLEYMPWWTKTQLNVHSAVENFSVAGLGNAR